MKKVITSILAIVLVLALFTGCAAPAQSNPDADNAASAQTNPDADNAAPAEKEAYKIGVCLPTVQEERWQNDFGFFQEEADKMDNVELVLQVADLSADKQISQIENLVTQGVDAIIIGAVDVAIVGPALQAAKNEGIYICAYCRLPENCDVDLLTLFNPGKIASMHAEYAYSLAPKGNYVILNGDIGSASEVYAFQDAWYEVLQPAIDAGDIKVVMDQFCAGWGSEDAMKFTENALAMTGNDISAIICACDGIAAGALAALEAQGLNDGSVVVTGNDADYAALKSIIDGTMVSTTAQETRKQVVLALETAVELIENGKLAREYDYTSNNGKMDVPVIGCDATMIKNEEDIQKILIDTGLRDKDKIYGNS